MDKVILPIHLGAHWCLAVIDFTNKKFGYYDSMGGTNSHCIKCLRQYVVDEYISKKTGKFDLSKWRNHVPCTSIPQQQNGFDCGMFMCKYADCMARDLPFNFSQGDMSFFRKRLILEMLNLNHDTWSSRVLNPNSQRRSHQKVYQRYTIPTISYIKTGQW